MVPNQRSALWRDLLSAATALGLPISCRSLEELDPEDDSLLYAWSDRKHAVVCVAEDVTWGPKFSSHVEPSGEYRTDPVLMIDVPNTLEGRVGEVMDALWTWFSD
jgi:hypothetical protein